MQKAYGNPTRRQAEMRREGFQPVSEGGHSSAVAFERRLDLASLDLGPAHGSGWKPELQNSQDGCSPFVLTFALFALVSLATPAAADTPALAPQTISLPTAPGSIDGLGESFEPQLNTGSYVFRIPLKLPPVRGKVQPEVSMTYNSGGGNGPLGLGWTLRIPSIQRQADKGLPNYDATDTYVTGDGSEIVARADGTFRAEVEQDFTKWENLGANGWQATRRDGNVLRFGATAQARQDRAAGQTFCWMLESVQDTNGNRVEYSYVRDAGQIYLSEARFGLHTTEASESFRLAFGYDDLRSDKLADYRGRFKCETRWRLRSATLWFGERRVRHWRFDYEAGKALTQLSRFTAYGDERTATDETARLNDDYLPPIEFDYSASALGANVEFVNVGPFTNISMASGEGRLSDLNRDGLPDVLLENSGKYESMLNRGPGQDFGNLTEFTTAAFYPSLTDPATRLADLRGDGTLKVLVDDGAGVYFREFTSGTTLGPDVDFALPGGFPLSDTAIQTVDINNDRAMDFMTVDVDRFAFILSGKGDEPNTYYESPQTPVASVVNFNSGWQLADMNGDRMPELVVIETTNGGGVVFYPGMGLGEFDSAVTMTGGPTDAELGARGLGGFSLVDLDGDGLSDLVQVDSGIVRVWPNRSGTGWGTAVVIDDPEVPDFLIGGTFVTFQDMNGNGTTDIVWNDPARGIFLKYLELHPATKPNLLVEMRNGMGRRLMLEYRTSTDYWLEAEAAGDPWTAIPPFPIPVVSAFTEHDGMGSVYRTEVTYRNGYYDGPEREFRGFERATQTEVGNDAQGAPSLVTEFEFDTGEAVEALKGQVRSSEVRTTDGQVFYRSETDWTARPLPGAPAAGEARAAAFPVKNAEITTVVEGGGAPPVTLKKEFEWDDFGNVLVSRDYGRVEGEDVGVWEDERIVRKTFTAASPSGQTNWILDLPVTETVENLAGVVKAVTRSFYDDPDFGGGNAGVVSKGNLTLVRKAIDPAAGSFISAQRMRYDTFGNPVEMLDPLGTAPGAPHSRSITYDNRIHTHPVSETVHIGGAVASVSMGAAYDVGLGVMTSSTDFNGHETRYGFDPFARIAHIVKPGDSDALPTESYAYHLGMPLEVGRTINWIETRARESAGGGTVDSRMFFDGLTRKIMRRAEGETPGQIVVTDTVVFNDRRTEWKTYLPYFETASLDFAEPTFATPFQEKHYDALGRVRRLYQPDTGNGRPFAETIYEPLARLQRDEEQTRADSPHFGAGFRYVEDGLKDEDGKGRLRVVEEIVKVDDAGNVIVTPRTWTTRYSYDVLDNFEGYLDSQDNSKSFLYDGLSRKVFMQDPDRGSYWWAYDDAGNVIRTCDAKNQHLAFTYDGANRITAEWHLETDAGGSAPAPETIWINPPAAPVTTPDVSYHYDLSAGLLARESFWRPREAEGVVKLILAEETAQGTADANGDSLIDVRDVALRSASEPVGPTIEGHNLLGRLAWVKDQAGEEHLSYDERGRAVWKVKRLQAPGDPEPLSFYVENRFDSMDRLTRHVYADGTFVDYGYNTRGLLETVGGAFAEVNYNPAGQNKTIALANGVTSQWQYDNRLRLERLTSTRQSDGLVVQDREFGYDEVSNITGITDHRNDTHRTAILAELSTAPTLAATDLVDSRGFEYDSLYRLIRTDGPAHGEHGYRFDPIGNMLVSTYQGDARFTPPNTGGMSYGETGHGPHVLTSLAATDGARTLEYDSNGNLTRDGQGATMSWDPKDRLIGATEDGAEHTHVYDYGSKRSIHTVTKEGRTSRTYYIDDVSEFRDGRLVKYVYVGSEKVARSDFSSEAGGAISPERFYLHDHLGSTTVAMDRNAEVTQISSHTPYGHDRFKGISGKKEIDYGFSGKELHAGPDLAYFETRFLSSGLGRFTQTDTLTLNPPEDWRMNPQKWHSYSYTWGNPMTMIDLDGRFAMQANGNSFENTFNQSTGKILNSTTDQLTKQQEHAAELIKDGFSNFTTSLIPGIVGSAISLSTSKSEGDVAWNLSKAAAGLGGQAVQVVEGTAQVVIGSSLYAGSRWDRMASTGTAFARDADISGPLDPKVPTTSKTIGKSSGFDSSIFRESMNIKVDANQFIQPPQQSPTIGPSPMRVILKP